MSQLDFPLQFKRQYAAPLDVDSVFITKNELTAYLTNPLRFSGQLATCLESEGYVFILNNNKNAWISLKLEKSYEKILLANNTTTTINLVNLSPAQILNFTINVVRNNSILIIDMEVVLLPDNETLQPNELRRLNYGDYENLNEESLTFTYSINNNILNLDVYLNEGNDATLNILKLK